MAISSPTGTARPFTWADLASMPDDGYRRELIGGTLVVTPAPLRRHQRVVSRLLVTLAAAAPDDVEILPAPFDWRTAEEGTVLQPDLMVVSRGDGGLDGALPATVVPSLVIEVLSPSNPAADLVWKRDTYQRLGVPAYWTVDPVAPAVTELRLDVAGAYRTAATASGSTRLRTDWPFPVEILPSALLA